MVGVIIELIVRMEGVLLVEGRTFPRLRRAISGNTCLLWVGRPKKKP